MLGTPFLSMEYKNFANFTDTIQMKGITAKQVRVLSV